MTMDGVRVEQGAHGSVRVTLDRPSAKNALSRAVNLELLRLAEALGADGVERRGVAAADSGPFIDAISGAIAAWGAMPKPTVALMNGYAFGGGLELALACDFRLAAEGALMGLSEVRLGIMPGAGGTQRLARLVGVARAKELVMTGRRIDARRALELGVVSRVIPGAELAAAGDELLAELAACAPLSLAMAKRAIDEGVALPMGDALALERRCYDVTLVSDDRNEGLRAFAEKRPPRFTGR